MLSRTHFNLGIQSKGKTLLKNYSPFAADYMVTCLPNHTQGSQLETQNSEQKIPTKWDKRFIDLAKLTASWSKDPSTKVGSCIADEDNRIISIGFNGFPRGVCDNPSRYKDRETKLMAILHAEENAIAFSGRRDLKGCTVYVWPFPPCSKCASIIIQSGVKRVVSCEPSLEQTERWGKSMGLAKSFFSEAGVELVLSKESN